MLHKLKHIPFSMTIYNKISYLCKTKFHRFFLILFIKYFVIYVKCLRVFYFRYSTIQILVLLSLLSSFVGLGEMLKNRTKYKRQMCINMMLFRMSIYGHLTFIYFVIHTHLIGIFCKLYPMHLVMSRNKNLTTLRLG
jgi:hypothetical protein